MTKQLEIEVLQRNKIIMAVEAVAVNTSVLIGIFLVDRYFPDGLYQDLLIISGGLFGIGYALYASLGNLQKHNQIKRLQRELSERK